MLLQKTTDITWQSHIANDKVTSKAMMPGMFSILILEAPTLVHSFIPHEGQSHPDEHVIGCLQAPNPMGRPTLRCEDVCKCDLRAGSVGPLSLKVAGSGCARWWFTVKTGIYEA